MTEAVIELGSNLLDREKNLNLAISALKKLPKTELIQVSSFYETEPFGVPDKQNKYINCCVKIKTELLPETLLGCCLGIEAAMGRVRTFKNASRIIDVDLLIYGDKTINTSDLQLPHPRILERAFVLVPLSELYADMQTPAFNFEREFNALDKSEVNKL